MLLKCLNVPCLFGQVYNHCFHCLLDSLPASSGWWIRMQSMHAFSLFWNIGLNVWTMMLGFCVDLLIDIIQLLTCKNWLFDPLFILFVQFLNFIDLKIKICRPVANSKDRDAMMYWWPKGITFNPGRNVK